MFKCISNVKKPFFLILLGLLFVSSNSYAENICFSSFSNADSGTINDSGGTSQNYSNFDSCGFLIQPSSSPSSITLSFSQFSLEFSYDFLYVYDGTNSSGTLLGSFTGTSLPNNLTASSGAIFIRFESDEIITSTGFSASWTSTNNSSTCNTVQDNFSNLSYSNNDGSQNWSNAWQEVGESDGVSAGKAQVRNDRCSSGFCLRLGTPSGVTQSSYSDRGVTRQANLGTASSATLTFNYFTGFSQGTSSATLSVSDDGGNSWSALQTYSISSNNTAANPESFDITPYISANTQIRFLASGSSTSVTGMYVDDIKIEYCQPIVSADPTPILEYKFDDCSLASSVEDSQGNFDGIATGADTSDTSSVLGGRSLDLTGTSTSDWVTVPKSAVTGLTDFSLSIWIKTGISSDEQNIFQALGSSTSDDELQIYLDEDDEVILIIKGEDEGLNANKTLTDNSWHHLVITRENDDVCLYVDGSQTDCDSGASTGTLSVSSTNSVVIGQEQDSFRNAASLNSGFDSSQSFKGYLDELKIYDSVLSASQVQTLYTAESSGDNTSSCVADLIASYNFDDDWVTNDSLTDQTGSYDGNPSGAVFQVSAGASGSKGDTCYAGSFNGGEIDITGLPVSTSTGAKTSVSFWMYWDGTNNVTVTGWYAYDLWLISGLFGFNTFGSDITGVSSSGLSSSWHHVAAVYTNGSVSNNKLYIDGVLQTISYQGGTVNTGNAVVQSALRIGGAIFGGYRFSGKLDNFKVYNGTITQTQVTADMNENNACPSVDTPAIAFNCVENGSNGITGKLYTKTTAQFFSFEIVALRDASTPETNFADGADHTVTVELVDNSSGGSCSAYSALSPAVSQSLVFTSSDTGKKTSTTMNSSTAYRSVKCRVTDATDSPAIVGCSTDSFSIRPISFSNIGVEKINVDTSRTALPYTDADSTPIAKAGDNLAITVTATTGYNETPSISSIEAHAGAINTGTLSGLFSPANSATGVATGSTFTYSEVGAFRFAAQAVFDTSFTAIDQSGDCTDDFSNTPDGNGKVGCKFANISTTAYFGRFTPDHFDVTLNTPVFTAGCGTFTYLGQPVKYATLPVASVTAKNAGNVTTQNYTGNFWKIDPDIGTGFTPLYSVASHSPTMVDSSKPVVSDSGNGIGTLTFSDTSSNILAVTKSALETPFDAEISLSFSLSDTDGIVVANVDGSAQINPVKFGEASSGNGISFSSKTHRWGRLALDNVHGSELTPLNVPIYTEYYNGSSFVLNTEDSCTDFTLPNANCTDSTAGNNFSISDAVDFDCAFATQTTPATIGASGSVKACMGNTTINNGRTPLTLSDNTNTANGPGAGNTGYVDITTKLTNLSWLWYDWDADGTHDNCPSARATFGIYKGNSQQIYFREVY